MPVVARKLDWANHRADRRSPDNKDTFHCQNIGGLRLAEVASWISVRLDACAIAHLLAFKTYF